MRERLPLAQKEFYRSVGRNYLFAQAAAHAATTSRIDVINAFIDAMAITGQIDESWSDGKLSLTKRDI